MTIQSNDQNDSVPIKRRVFSLPSLLFLIVIFAFGIFLATRLDLDWGLIWQNVKAMDPWIYLLGMGLYYLSFIFRGLRWRILATNAGVDDKENDIRLPSILHLSQLIIIGWFVNAVAWLRLGDAYRAYAFAEDSGQSFSWSLGTVLAERIMDMFSVFVLILIGVAFFSVTYNSDGMLYVLTVAFVMVLGLGMLLVLMKQYGRKMVRIVPVRFQKAYDRFQQGTFGSFKQIPLLFILGLIGWFLEAARLYFVLAALDLSMSLSLVLLVALGHAILSTVPTPGGVGVVEPGITGLLVLGLDYNDAVSVALVDRSITYFSVVLFGFLAFALWQFRRSRKKHEFVTGHDIGT